MSFIFSDTTKKRFDGEKHLSKNLEDKDRIEREFLKKREQVNKLTKSSIHLPDIVDSNRTLERSGVNRRMFSIPYFNLQLITDLVM
jgi:hypothetical protein